MDLVISGLVSIFTNPTPSPPGQAGKIDHSSSARGQAPCTRMCVQCVIQVAQLHKPHKNRPTSGTPSIEAGFSPTPIGSQHDSHARRSHVRKQCVAKGTMRWKQIDSNNAEYEGRSEENSGSILNIVAQRWVKLNFYVGRQP